MKIVPRVLLSEREETTRAQEATDGASEHESFESLEYGEGGSPEVYSLRLYHRFVPTPWFVPSKRLWPRLGVSTTDPVLLSVVCILRPTQSISIRFRSRFCLRSVANVNPR